MIGPVKGLHRECGLSGRLQFFRRVIENGRGVDVTPLRWASEGGRERERERESRKLSAIASKIASKG